MTRLWSSRGVVLAGAVAIVATAAPARAAQITTDQKCYADPDVRDDKVMVSGSAFEPSTPFTAMLDSSPLDALKGTTDSKGAFKGSFPTPELPAGRTQKSFRLKVAAGASSPEAVFAVSTLSAKFTPKLVGPRAKVRFHLRGFALSGEEQPNVYVHYVSPKGLLKKTVSLGKTSGSCGRLESGKRSLFPFTPSHGSWRLQFDNAYKYRKGSPAGSFLYYDIGVDIS